MMYPVNISLLYCAPGLEKNQKQYSLSGLKKNQFVIIWGMAEKKSTEQYSMSGLKKNLSQSRKTLFVGTFNKHCRGTLKVFPWKVNAVSRVGVLRNWFQDFRSRE